MCLNSDTCLYSFLILSYFFFFSIPVTSLFLHPSSPPLLSPSSALPHLHLHSLSSLPPLLCYLFFPSSLNHLKHIFLISLPPLLSFTLLISSSLHFPLSHLFLVLLFAFILPSSPSTPLSAFGLLRFQRYKWRRADCFQGICL